MPSQSRSPQDVDAREGLFAMQVSVCDNTARGMIKWGRAVYSGRRGFTRPTNPPRLLYMALLWILCKRIFLLCGLNEGKVGSGCPRFSNETTSGRPFKARFQTSCAMQIKVRTKMKRTCRSPQQFVFFFCVNLRLLLSTSFAQVFFSI